MPDDSRLPRRSPPTGLWGEFRRRRVFRVAAAYAVVSWGLMQAGEIVFPAFELSNRALRMLILMLVGGLPIVVALAWLLEVTTRGVRLTGGGEDAAPGAGEDAPGGARSLETILLGMVLPIVAAALLFGFQLVVGDAGEGVAPSPTPTARALERSAGSGAEGSAASDTSQPAGDGRVTLAVLPLEDRSSDPDPTGFFAAGMHEDILTSLAGNRDLRLIARRSVLPWAGSDAPLAEVGRALGADHVLTGSVRRLGRHVRVSVRLIRLAGEEQVWAEVFDAELEDVFAVQTRIATAISRALALELSDRASPSSPRRVEPAAYDAYLKGRDLHRSLETSDLEDIRRIQTLYEEALRLDPDLAPAWLQLGILHAELVGFGFDPSDERRARARAGLDRAREIGLDEASLALGEGILAYYVDRDLGRALLRFDDVVRLAPARGEGHFYRAMILRRSGALEAAREAQTRALALDPLNLADREEYALTLAMLGELASARAELSRVLRRDPARPRARLQAWQLDLELDGRPDRVLAEMLEAGSGSAGDAHARLLALVAVLADRGEGLFERWSKAGDGGKSVPLLIRADLARRLGRSAEHAALVAEARRRHEAPGAEGGERADALALEREAASRIGLELVANRPERALELLAESGVERALGDDVIRAGPVLWDRLNAEARAGRMQDAARTLERLVDRMALGSVPFAGYYVLAHDPDFAAARSSPDFARVLVGLWPEYVADWPTPPAPDAGGATAR